MDNLTKAFIGLAAIGVVDAIYHGYESATLYHQSWCNIFIKNGCFTVAGSSYAHIDGVPLYATGLVWFPLLLILGLRYGRRKGDGIVSLIFLPLLMVGNVFTVYLWYTEIYLIHAFCLICISLYVINYMLTGICAFALTK